MNDKQEWLEAYGFSDEENFIKNMQILREQRGWSQGEFARQMQAQGWTSFHQTTVSRIEKAERPVRLGEARGIAQVLGESVQNMVSVDSIHKGFYEFQVNFRNLLDTESELITTAKNYEQIRAVVLKLVDDIRPTMDSLPNDVNGALLRDGVEWAEEYRHQDALFTLKVTKGQWNGVDSEKA